MASFERDQQIPKSNVSNRKDNKYPQCNVKRAVAAGCPGQDQVEDPEAGEGNPVSEGGVQRTVQDQMSHTSCVW